VGLALPELKLGELDIGEPLESDPEIPTDPPEEPDDAGEAIIGAGRAGT